MKLSYPKSSIYNEIDFIVRKALNMAIDFHGVPLENGLRVHMTLSFQDDKEAYIDLDRIFQVIYKSNNRKKDFIFQNLLNWNFFIAAGSLINRQNRLLGHFRITTSKRENIH